MDWLDPGWRDEMTSWVDGRLADAGIRRRGDLTEVRTWGRSALLTFETDRGRLWAKAVPEVFAHGALATARTVLPLHIAALHAERILPSVEPSSEMERVVPNALRAILTG